MPVAIDNDVLQKLSSYGLIPDLQSVLAPYEPIGVLGAARFIVRRALGRLNLGDVDALKTSFEEFIQGANEMEPTDEEIALATEFEEVANKQLLGFDAGESQLCAIAIVRGLDAVITGDKRAIVAAETVRGAVDALSALVGKLVCLEQLMLGVINSIGHEIVRPRVCAVRAVDKALSICLKCWNPGDPDQEAITEAFQSYIEDLRTSAPSLLCEGHAFPNS